MKANRSDGGLLLHREANAIIADASHYYDGYRAAGGIAGNLRHYARRAELIGRERTSIEQNLNRLRGVNLKTGAIDGNYASWSSRRR